MRGRGRGRGRGGRAVRGGRGVSFGERWSPRTLLTTLQPRKSQPNGTAGTEEATPANVPGQVDPLVETTNGTLTANNKDAETTTDATKMAKPRSPRERKQRGPPEDGVPSKTKVMVANLPYDLGEEKVRIS